jgi:hypothetical protein
MTPASFKKQLGALGFAYIQNPPFGSRFTRSAGNLLQHVARESVRGSSWRLCLAVGDIPPVWPALEFKPTTSWDEAESPWFTYYTDLDENELNQFDTRNVALQKCYDWLVTIGFEWLNNPRARSTDDWRKACKILVMKAADRP